VFDTLTNGGFEVTRTDGTPYGWKDVGAELQSVPADRVEGTRSLAMTSRTSSTKWAYQTVRVQPGVFYEASGYTWNPGAEETFLRVSWYASDDGSGSAIDSVDSTANAAAGATFQRLTTGPTQVPDNAQTARVRLMLRPGLAEAVTVYFDAVTFAITDARPAPDDQDSGPGRPDSSDGSRNDDGSFSQDADSTLVPLVENARLGFANVQPVATPATAASASAGSNYDWLAVLGVVISGCAITFAVWLDRARHRRTSDPG
jgi:hypothetical protein